MTWLDSLSAFLMTETAVKLLISLLIVTILWAVSHFAKKIVSKRISDREERYRWINIVSYLFIFLGIIIMGRVWLGGFKFAATYLGLLSAGIAIALSSLISNFAGWIFILVRKPFIVGDRIQINDVCGDVIDLRLFQFTLMEIGNWVQADQPTGRFVYVPNGMVFSTPVFNYDAGFEYLWEELTFVISYTSNWEKANDILLAATINHSMKITPEIELEIHKDVSRYLVNKHNLLPDTFMSIGNNGIKLTARYLTEVRKRRSIAAAIQKEVLIEFRKHTDITFTDLNTTNITLNK